MFSKSTGIPGIENRQQARMTDHIRLLWKIIADEPDTQDQTPLRDWKHFGKAQGRGGALHEGILRNIS